MHVFEIFMDLPFRSAFGAGRPPDPILDRDFFFRMLMQLLNSFIHSLSTIITRAN